MPSIVEQLIDMGFAKERAEKAYSLAGDSLEAAMDWLISHEDDDIVVSTEKESVEMDSKVVVNEHIQSSYKCNDCNELFRDENGMMWHNIKSGHESFSETTETITPLTPEELEQKSTELRKRIKTARAQREENERKEQV
uniref:UBA domain-containing protein n=1 Tax=Heterorhabditis bacteriophora TaxID=37862 RepID=A0A1I7WCB4_HETBA